MLRHFAQNSHTCPRLEPPESPPNQASPIPFFPSLCSSPLKKFRTNRGLNAETCGFLQVIVYASAPKLCRDLLVQCPLPLGQRESASLPINPDRLLFTEL